MHTSRCRLGLLACLLLALPAERAAAQEKAATSPAARPEDVASVDAILAALYDVISGPAGQARDWDRFRSLFLPGAARLIAVGKDPQTGAKRQLIVDPQGYAERVGPRLERDGFFEREIGRREDRFGNVVHVFSAYESLHTLSDPEPFARGVNSIQLLHDGTRWWIVTVLWDTSEGQPDPRTLPRHEVSR
ncbi:MAG TPA: hypothetical protein VIL18_07850 [Longimicrobiales bacterium]